MQCLFDVLLIITMFGKKKKKYINFFLGNILIMKYYSQNNINNIN